jgi:hypothetical protein
MYVSTPLWHHSVNSNVIQYELPVKIGCNKRNASIREIDHLWLQLIPVTFQPQPSFNILNNRDGNIYNDYPSHQPLIWIQNAENRTTSSNEKKDPASLVSLVPPFEVHTIQKPSFFQRARSESTTFTKMLVNNETKTKKNESNGGMSGYQIYRYYHDYHEVGEFFTHPSIGLAQHEYNMAVSTSLSHLQMVVNIVNLCMGSQDP